MKNDLSYLNVLASLPPYTNFSRVEWKKVAYPSTLNKGFQESEVKTGSGVYVKTDGAWLAAIRLMKLTNNVLLKIFCFNILILIPFYTEGRSQNH